jgi:hypothetical protein
VQCPQRWPSSANHGGLLSMAGHVSNPDPMPGLISYVLIITGENGLIDNGTAAGSEGFTTVTGSSIGIHSRSGNEHVPVERLQRHRECVGDHRPHRARHT